MSDWTSHFCRWFYLFNDDTTFTSFTESSFPKSSGATCRETHVTTEPFATGEADWLIDDSSNPCKK